MISGNTPPPILTIHRNLLMSSLGYLLIPRFQCRAVWCHNQGLASCLHAERRLVKLASVVSRRLCALCATQLPISNALKVSSRPSILGAKIRVGAQGFRLEGFQPREAGLADRGSPDKSTKNNKDVFYIQLPVVLPSLSLRGGHGPPHSCNVRVVPSVVVHNYCPAVDRSRMSSDF